MTKKKENNLIQSGHLEKVQKVEVDEECFLIPVVVTKKTN